MDRMYYINTTTPRTEVYIGDSEADLQKMPTTTTIGQAPYKAALAPKGSIAKIITSNGIKKYELGLEGWIEAATERASGEETIKTFTFTGDGKLLNQIPGGKRIIQFPEKPSYILKIWGDWYSTAGNDTYTITGSPFVWGEKFPGSNAYGFTIVYKAKNKADTGTRTLNIEFDDENTAINIVANPISNDAGIIFNGQIKNENNELVNATYTVLYVTADGVENALSSLGG